MGRVVGTGLDLFHLFGDIPRDAIFGDDVAVNSLRPFIAFRIGFNRIFPGQIILLEGRKKVGLYLPG